MVKSRATQTKPAIPSLVETELLMNGLGEIKGSIPFNIGMLKSPLGGDLGVLYPRLERDGWRRSKDNYGGWYWQPSDKHPTLRMHYKRGYLEHGRNFEFRLDDYPKMLDSTVDWASWDFLGNLVFAKQGKLYKYQLVDLNSTQPSFCKDLEFIEPP